MSYNIQLLCSARYIFSLTITIASILCRTFDFEVGTSEPKPQTFDVSLKS